MTEGDCRFHFFLDGLFPLLPADFFRQDDRFGMNGLQNPFPLGSILKGHFDLAANISGVLAPKLQWAADSGRRYLQYVMESQPASGINVFFEVPANPLALFESHARIAIGKNLQLVASPQFDLHDKAIGESFFQKLFLQQGIYFLHFPEFC